MTNSDLARTLDAVANQMQVVAGLTSELRRSIGADAQTLADLEGSGERVMSHQSAEMSNRSSRLIRLRDSNN